MTSRGVSDHPSSNSASWPETSCEAPHGRIRRARPAADAARSGRRAAARRKLRARHVPHARSLVGCSTSRTTRNSPPRGLGADGEGEVSGSSPEKRLVFGSAVRSPRPVSLSPPTLCSRRLGRLRRSVRAIPWGAGGEPTRSFALGLSRSAITGEQSANVLLDAGLPLGLLCSVARVHHVRRLPSLRLLLDGASLVSDRAAPRHGSGQSSGRSPSASHSSPGYPFPVRTSAARLRRGSGTPTGGPARALLRAARPRVRPADPYEPSALAEYTAG
jgi:hypothetical protein